MHVNLCACEPLTLIDPCVLVLFAVSHSPSAAAAAAVVRVRSVPSLQRFVVVHALPLLSVVVRAIQRLTLCDVDWVGLGWMNKYGMVERIGGK